MTRQRERRGVGEGQAHREHDEPQRHEHQHQRGVGQRGHEQGGRRDHAQDHPGGEDVLRLPPAQQERVDLGRDDQSCGVDPEEDAELLLVQAVVLLEHERRAGDVGEEGAEHQAREQHEADERTVAQQNGIRAQGGADPRRPPTLHRQGLVHPAERDDEEHDGDARPVRTKIPRQPVSCSRRPPSDGARMGATPMTSVRWLSEPGRAPTGEEVAHDGHRGDGDRRTGDALTDAHRGEHLDRRRERGQHGHHRVGGDAAEHDAATAHGIRDRAQHELAETEAEHDAGEGELHLRLGGSQARRRASAAPAGRCRWSGGPAPRGRRGRGPSAGRRDRQAWAEASEERRRSARRGSRRTWGTGRARTAWLLGRGSSDHGRGAHR